MKEETRGSHSCAGTNGVTGCERPLLDFNLFGESATDDIRLLGGEGSHHEGDPSIFDHHVPLSLLESIDFFVFGTCPLLSNGITVPTTSSGLYSRVHLSHFHSKIFYHICHMELFWMIMMCVLKSVAIQNISPHLSHRTFF